MAKKSGLGATLAVDDGTGTSRATSNDFLSVSVSTPRGVQDITGIDKSAIERLLLLARDGGEVVGHGLAQRSDSAGAGSVIPRVLPEHRRRGPAEVRHPRAQPVLCSASALARLSAKSALSISAPRAIVGRAGHWTSSLTGHSVTSDTALHPEPRCVGVH